MTIETANLVPVGSSRIPNWISGGSYVIGDQVVSPSSLLPYIRKTIGGGVTDPSSDITNWQVFGESIKGIQRGTISVATSNSSGTATITAVNTAKSILFNLGIEGDTTRGGRLALTNSTTITATVNAAGATALNVSYQIVEYY